MTIAPELMGHVAIAYDWKEFVFHRGCSFSIQSILENGLIAGGKQSKEGRQTIFFTPLNPFGENPDEEAPSDDFICVLLLGFEVDSLRIMSRSQIRRCGNVPLVGTTFSA